MPICTSCTHPTEYLYTLYDSADNLRLEQCSACHAFADPYVEHDTLTLWIDLILLKRDVYRHLLFNRGTGARKLSGTRNNDGGNESSDNAGKRGQQTEPDSQSQEAAERRRRETDRWLHICKLGSALVAVDAFIRWAHLNSSRLSNASQMDTLSWNQEAVEGFLRILIGCLIETAGFHAGVMLASFLVLRTLARLREKFLGKMQKRSGILSEFRYSRIPLSLLYSSLNKLFLLFLLALWRPVVVSSDSVPPLSQQYDASRWFNNSIVVSALEILDDDNLDREWVVRNILGGMAAGFGLRVVLDCHPIFTTMIILAGWAVKTALANIVSGWVSAGIGGNEPTAGEMWLAYSIP